MHIDCLLHSAQSTLSDERPQAREHFRSPLPLYNWFEGDSVGLRWVARRRHQQQAPSCVMGVPVSPFPYRETLARQGHLT
jgi:phospholipid N-methyltransferase